ncbi:FadR/GntR family transcriptional regulator [Marinobacterium zhoushanense]|uniref:FadR/GntR family transcriptional regulator n=1 Tax=Marinobacterium zhoushanense TaxID=1679163 RepID=UPI001E4B9F80|nr:FadR/GntR family transcriptional regulator [Marinobacterium zhoushanense]
MNQSSTLPTADTEPKRKRPRKLAQTLVAEISRQIAEGELKPGEKLPTETAIMEQHGVSRTVVREALQRLQVSGLVETRHGVGTFILESSTDVGQFLKVSIDSVRDTIAILEFRLGLEVEAVGLAAERRSPEQMARLRETVDALKHYESEGLAEQAGKEDSRFHILIAEATGNRYYVDVMNHVRNSIGPLVSVHRTDPERLNHEHEEICAAIERQDSYSARAAMRLHLVNSKERLLKMVKERQQA